MKILAIMPARSGSKGIKNKNLYNFLGKPLVSYTLNILKKLNHVVYPFVSTDSNKIYNYAKKFGINNNYIRPKGISKDNSNVVEAVFDALNWLKKKKLNFEYIVLLQPTSPKRNIKDVIRMINYIKKNDINSSATACRLPFHPTESLLIKDDKWKYLKKNDKKIFRRQDFDQNYYFIDGSFYMCKVSFLKKNKSFVKENSTYIFKNNTSFPIDINDKLDLKIAEVIFKSDK
jgi:CMP-N-acetylneuraminic acid synthetase